MKQYLKMTNNLHLNGKPTYPAILPKDESESKRFRRVSFSFPLKFWEPVCSVGRYIRQLNQLKTSCNTSRLSTIHIPHISTGSSYLRKSRQLIRGSDSIPISHGGRYDVFVGLVHSRRNCTCLPDVPAVRRGISHLRI